MLKLISVDKPKCCDHTLHPNIVIMTQQGVEGYLLRLKETLYDPSKHPIFNPRGVEDSGAGG